MSNALLIQENNRLDETGVYIGALVLEQLAKKSSLSIFDLYELLRKKVDNVNYSNTMDGLVFLHMIGAIEFRAPYIIKIQ